MATYTSNYNLTKPTMAESADIRVINGNMDTVDEIMHDTQISMADAFDANKQGGYVIRDLVMYEFKLYQCIHPHTGPWDAENWVRVNAAETGGNYVEITPTYQSGLKIADTNIDGDQDEIDVPYFGGATAQQNGTGGAVPAPASSDVGKFLSSNGGWETPSGGGGGTTVVPNPVGEPTDDLDTVQIGNTIYNIPGSGGGSAYKETVLYTNSGTTAGDIALSDNLDNYDVLSFRVVRSSGDYVDLLYLTAGLVANSKITLIGYNGEYINYTVADMDTLTLTASSSNYVSEVTGVKFGGGIFTEKLSDMTWTLLDSTTATSSGVAIPSGTKYLVLTAELGGYVSMIAAESVEDIEKLADVANGVFNQGYEYADIAGNHTTVSMSVNNNVVTIKSGYNTVTARVYALSGGVVPYTLHKYDSNEKLVGEWFGEPLYEKTVVIKENGTDNYTYNSEVYQNCLPVSDFINITQMYAARGDTVGYVDVVSNQNEVYYVPNKNGDLYFKSSHSPTDIIVTVQYTKPTI